MDLYKQFDKVFVEFAKSLKNLDELEKGPCSSELYEKVNREFRESRDDLLFFLYEMARDYNKNQ